MNCQAFMVNGNQKNMLSYTFYFTFQKAAFAALSDGNLDRVQ